MANEAAADDTGGRAWQRLSRGFELDLRSLAAYRIALGSIIVLDVVQRLPAYAAAYSDYGFLPRDALLPLPPSWFSLFFASGRPLWALGCLILTGLAGVALAVGVRTRAAALLCWVLVTSLHVRNSLMLDFGDEWIRVQLLWCCLLPLGARFSWDARWTSEKPAQRCLSLASIGFGLQLFVFYFVAGALKTGPEWTGDGNAIMNVMRNSYWARPLAEWMLQSPAMLAVVSRIVPIFEIGAPLLLISPVATGALRILGILLLLGFQVGLASTMQLNLFPLVNIAATLPFLPGSVWDWLAARWPGDTKDAIREETLRTDKSLGTSLPAGLLIVLMLCLLPAPAMPTRDALEADTYRYLGFHQMWGMYAPSPPKLDVLPQLVGRRRGAEVDLQTGLLGGSWQELQGTLNEYRYRYFLERLSQAGPGGDRVSRAHLSWLCRESEARLGIGFDSIGFRVRFREIDGPGEQPLQVRGLMDIRCKAG